MNEPHWTQAEAISDPNGVHDSMMEYINGVMVQDALVELKLIFTANQFGDIGFTIESETERGLFMKTNLRKTFEESVESLFYQLGLLDF